MKAFEQAMKMEVDGRAYYLEHAQKASIPALKKILLELADDELKHYNLFKELHESQSATYDEAGATTIYSTTKNVFELLKDEKGGQDLPTDPASVWEHARRVEKDSEDFYREKAAETDDASQKNIWIAIADEEHKHYTAIDHVVDFLKKPTEWLENAEWSGLSD